MQYLVVGVFVVLYFATQTIQKEGLSGLYSVPFCCSTNYILDEVSHICRLCSLHPLDLLSCPLKGPLQAKQPHVRKGKSTGPGSYTAREQLLECSADLTDLFLHHAANSVVQLESLASYHLAKARLTLAKEWNQAWARSEVKCHLCLSLLTNTG